MTPIFTRKRTKGKTQICIDNLKHWAFFEHIRLPRGLGNCKVQTRLPPSIGFEIFAQSPPPPARTARSVANCKLQVNKTSREGENENEAPDWVSKAFEFPERKHAFVGLGEQVRKYIKYR